MPTAPYYYIIYYRYIYIKDCIIDTYLEILEISPSFCLVAALFTKILIPPSASTARFTISLQLTDKERSLGIRIADPPFFST